MDLYEHLVLSYLTRDRGVFVSPQYSISADDETEWSCPDFVAIDFTNHKVLVVEVSTAWNPKSLREKVANRERQWLQRLRNQLRARRVIDERWKDEDFEVHVFVRQDAKPAFERSPNAPNVKITTFEQIGPPWKWDRS